MNEARQKWVEALRSGKYKQIQNAMFEVDGEDIGFCCLGVLCEISPMAEGLDWKTNNSFGLIVYDWADMWVDSRREMRNDFSTGQFVYLNDELGWSFDQIADYIENYNGE